MFPDCGQFYLLMQQGLLKTYINRCLLGLFLLTVDSPIVCVDSISDQPQALQSINLLLSHSLRKLGFGKYKLLTSVSVLFCSAVKK